MARQSAWSYNYQFCTVSDKTTLSFLPFYMRILSKVKQLLLDWLFVYKTVRPCLDVKDSTIIENQITENHGFLLRVLQM